MHTATMALIGGFGPQELIIIFLILLLIFGGSRIPGIARALGKSMKEFKKGQQDGEEESPSAPDSSGSRQEPAETKDPAGRNHAQP